MGLLEDVVYNAKAAVNAVGQKAGQIVDISKLRLNTADLNNEISKRFESLGRIVYDAKKTENSSADLVEECVLTIDDLYQQLDEVNEQIAKARNRVKCKSCGYENAQEAVYCNRCGAKLEEEAKAESKEEEPVQNVKEDREDEREEASPSPSQQANVSSEDEEEKF